jgi:DNA-binding response OmpR family regulator
MATSHDSIRVVFVGPPDEDYRCLSAICSRSNWSLYRVEQAGQSALEQLRRLQPQVVIASDQLTNGWQCFLQCLPANISPNPRLIVASRHADESLWLDVLNGGAFDLVRTPFERWELLRTIGEAAREWFAEQDCAESAPLAAVV